MDVTTPSPPTKPRRVPTGTDGMSKAALDSAKKVLFRVQPDAEGDDDEDDSVIDDVGPDGKRH